MGSVAKLTSSNGIYTIIITDYDGYNTTYSVDATTYKMYYGPQGGSATIMNDSAGNKVIQVTDPSGKKTVYSSNNKPILKVERNNSPTSSSTSTISPTKYSKAYSSSLPKGIPKSMIPPGNEDLYILKSEVVPPVCPVCPPQYISSSNGKNNGNSGNIGNGVNGGNNDKNSYPPCPPCARCPEPSFECKKVPNYSSGGGNQYLPQPVVSNFSTFGM
jgi:hypothetical protein